MTLFEAAKLRLVNAPQSGIAYLGVLVGYQTVYEAFSDKLFEEFFAAMTGREIIPALTPPRTTTGVLDLSEYRDEIFDRFRISTVEHLLSQIVWDGSQKLPERVFGAVRDNLASGHSIRALALILAGWRRFCARKVELDEEIVDPFASRIAAATWVRERDPVKVVDELLQFDAFMTRDLAEHAGFRDALIRAERALGDGDSESVRAAMQEYITGDLQKARA